MIGTAVSIVRELHVYGTAVPVDGRDSAKLQHQVMYLVHQLFYVTVSVEMNILGVMCSIKLQKIIGVFSLLTCSIP